MRVFLDTNVLVSAFATRGLCADVLRQVLSDHELVLGEPVLHELRRALREKLKLPKAQIEALDEFLGEYEVVPRPRKLGRIPVRDASDRWILATAVAGKADVLVTGDGDLLAVARSSPLPIMSPREFWTLLRQSGRKDG